MARYGYAARDRAGESAGESTGGITEPIAGESSSLGGEERMPSPSGEMSASAGVTPSEEMSSSNSSDSQGCDSSSSRGSSTSSLALYLLALFFGLKRKYDRLI